MASVAVQSSLSSVRLCVFTQNIYFIAHETTALVANGVIKGGVMNSSK